MRINSSYLFGLALVILMLSGVFLALNHQGFAFRLINLNFWVLLAAVIFYIAEIKK